MLTKREQAELNSYSVKNIGKHVTDILAQCFGGNLVIGEKTKIVHASTKANIMAK